LSLSLVIESLNNKMSSRNHDRRVGVPDAVSTGKKRRREQQEETSSNNNVFQTEDEDGGRYYSHIRRIDDDTRLAHLAAILPLTTLNAKLQRRELVDFRVYLQISVYLAWHHLQLHHSDMDPTHRAVLPDVVQQRLKGCDLQFSLSLHDSQFSPLYAARQLVNVLTRTKAQVVESTASTMPKGRRRIAAAAAAAASWQNSGHLDLHDTGRRDIEISPLPESNSSDSNSTPSYVAQRLVQQPPPMALLGAARSAVTVTLSGLSSVYGIPQISGSSTASVLDDKARHPLLARTVPTNAGDARAAFLYLQHAAVQIQHLVVLYVGDDFGTNYHAALIREAAAAAGGAKQPMSIRSIQYTTEESMELALKQLKESGIRFVLGILNPQSWKQLLSRAAALDIAGPGTGYTWFLTEANLEVSNPEFALDGSTKDSQDALVAQALHGAGIILIHIPNHEAMDQALQDFRHDVVLQQDFAAKFQDDDDVEAKMLLQNYTYPPVGQSFYQYLYYDAMMALGIAACETKNRDLFTGQELYQQLLQTEFPGVSGTVSFDPFTGTRQSQNFQFRIVNLMMRQDNDEDADATNEDDGKIRFRTQIAALVHPPPNNDASTTSTNMELVELLAPFVYADSTTRVPVDLNPLVQDWNLITPAFRGVGLTLGLLAMISSMGWMIWTLCHRKKDVVQSSQPFFLVQLCIGTLIMSSAIIPLSLQEPVNDRVLDICCMSIPW
jgi:ABC-type branched-subunit amino acid transport system substrate-binding protein